MITHIDSIEIDKLIRVHREVRDIYSLGQLRWLMESEKIDTLQRLRKALFHEYFEPTFFRIYGFDNMLAVANVSEEDKGDSDPFKVIG